MLFRSMTTKELAYAASTIWVLIAAVLVMFMQAGFAFLEAGLTRMKNVGHIAAKNVLIFALASVVYYIVGFAIAFGDGGNGFMGSLSAAAPALREVLTQVADVDGRRAENLLGDGNGGCCGMGQDDAPSVRHV